MTLKLDKATGIFMALAAGSGLACYALEGGDAAWQATIEAASLLVMVLPQIAAGLLIGGFAQALISKDTAAEYLGAESGLRGLLVATVAGIVTPGGPFTSFPLVYALWTSGADVGALVAYLVSWALIGLHRIVVWELPFMGPEFALLRFVVCLPLPLLAGIFARLIVEHTSLKLKGGSSE
ncbi:permease [Polymorphum gilvum]|uniref:Permease n=1 Tax=Polymorphum gilvum (strain LMG 25793 / CGMCC 1.9160 / SL003B-26A1) TaxID=991905 RepID=F2IYY2_POLGS|nr:permease [Polymorphum gilvum]ADZ70597.1 hypothetical protein SL003B_2172 [Polymorphum gilvum SL003B-26A1]